MVGIHTLAQSQTLNRIQSVWTPCGRLWKWQACHGCGSSEEGSAGTSLAWPIPNLTEQWLTLPADGEVLTSLISKKTFNTELQRWSRTQQKFSFDVKHVPRWWTWLDILASWPQEQWCGLMFTTLRWRRDCDKEKEQLAFFFFFWWERRTTRNSSQGTFYPYGPNEEDAGPILHPQNFKSLPMDRWGGWRDWLTPMILDIPSVAYKLEKWSSWRKGRPSLLGMKTESWRPRALPMTSSAKTVLCGVSMTCWALGVVLCVWSHLSLDQHQEAGAIVPIFQREDWGSVGVSSWFTRGQQLVSG